MKTFALRKLIFYLITDPICLQGACATDLSTSALYPVIHGGSAFKSFKMNTWILHFRFGNTAFAVHRNASAQSGFTNRMQNALGGISYGGLVLSLGAWVHIWECFFDTGHTFSSGAVKDIRVSRQNFEEAFKKVRPSVSKKVSALNRAQEL